MDQLQKVKSYFIKVDREFHPEKYEKKKKEKTHEMIESEQMPAQNPEKPIKRIIERTVATNQNILDKLAKKAEAKKGGKNARDFMSADSGSDKEEEKTEEKLEE